MTVGSNGPAATEILLLGDPSPALRLRVLTELLDVPEDDPEVTDLRQRLRGDGLVRDAVGESPGWSQTCFRLCRLGYLGLGPEHPEVGQLAESVFARQQADGSFPLAAFAGEGSRYATVPLQTSLPLRGLAAAGFARDPRAERGYEWLLDQRLDDGAWPTGMASGHEGFVAGYRRLPGSRGCRANTTGALACLALHPVRRSSPEARAALDLLLQRETREEETVGTEVARLVGAQPPTGFFTFYALFDLAFVLDLASRMGASAQDARVEDLVGFLLTLRSESGLWEHPTHPELSRWLTLDILLSLRRLQYGDWQGAIFRTPFRAYSRRRRRY